MRRLLEGLVLAGGLASAEADEELDAIDDEAGDRGPEPDKWNDLQPCLVEDEVHEEAPTHQIHNNKHSKNNEEDRPKRKTTS